MSIIGDADGSEDVNDFLLRIRELGDQRDKEDEERTRKLEEEIIQGRKERQARRAERARSLSPTKDTSSNVGTPGSARSRNNLSMQEQFSRTPSLQPPAAAGVSQEDAPERTNGAQFEDDSPNNHIIPRELPQPPSKPQVLSNTSPSAAMPLARAGTLSWQQRPTSRGSTGPRSRPLSVQASENAARSPRASVEPATLSNEAMSRDQIAQSLGSRDPSWFKQTQERGAGSAAFRRNQVEDTSDTASSTGSMRLPGMLRESNAESESRISPPPQSVRSDRTSKAGSMRDMSRSQNSSGSGPLSLSNSIGSPLPTMSSQKFEPPSSDTISTTSAGDSSSLGRTLAMSPSQGRISPERADRPASPTKGLGGFVQSAMLKRSDSVNKRWSAQIGPGLSRGNSTASNLSGYAGSRYPLGGITPLVESRPGSISSEGSPRANPRPTSSHSNVTITQSIAEDDRPGTSTSLASSVSSSRFDESFPVHNPREIGSPAPVEEVMSLPSSPSKRWSPTKSSWLENALNKPDSPKIKPPALQQPAWMSEIGRAKQQRGSVDLGKGGSTFKQVSIGGLVRSPPPGAGYRPPTIGGLPSGFSAGVATKSRNGSLDDAAQTSTLPEPAENDSKASSRASKEPSPPDQSMSQGNTMEDKPDIPATTASTQSRAAKKPIPSLHSRTASPTATKPKPETPPKRDFRSTVKSPQTSGEKKSKEEPEFKNVFGNLKRTQTKNYVAPDELKDTIMRGKSGLAQTGGPKKPDRKDDFKESILQKNQGMVPPSASTRIMSASSKHPDQSTPEAIAKRKVLARSESVQSIDSAEGKQVSKPEALAKLAHLRDKPVVTSSEKQSSAAATIPKGSEPRNGLGGTFASSLAGVLQRGPSPMLAKPTATEPAAETPGGRLTQESGEPDRSSEGPQLTHVTKARARGPKRKPPTVSQQEVSTPLQGTKPDHHSDPQDKTSLVENQFHIVARHPKPQALPPNPSKPEPRPLSHISHNHNNNNNRKPSQPLSPRKPSTHIAPPADLKSTSSVSQAANDKVQLASSPPLERKPAKTQKVANNSQVSEHASSAFPDPLSERKSTLEPPTSFRGQENRKPDRDDDDDDTTLPSVKGAAAIWGQSAKSSQLNRAKSPVRLPTRKDEEAALEEAGLKAKEPADLASKTPVKAPQKPIEHEQQVSAAQSPRSPPLPGKKPSSIATRTASTTLPSPVTTQRPFPTAKPNSTHVGAFFADIFDEPPSCKSTISIDTQAVLDSRSSPYNSPKIKTLRKQTFEIGDNGKSVPVPSQEEHVLYEDSLYLCTHVFGTLAGQRTTEVYLWCGDGVPTATVEDAQLFAKKVAKDNNGKLVVLKQGRETTNFFQALGGIVITRRGSASKEVASAGSESAYILCGRQHVGQIAFDELEYSPRSLCPGFPYIVSAPGGKLYLWKGSGSGADELGCARLIGMDLGVSGDIEEVDEGCEPDAFWASFPGGKRGLGNEQTVKAQHWHLKPSYEKYTTRLFNVGTPRPKSGSGPIQGAMQWVRRGSAPAGEMHSASTAQIKEVMPFAQSNLSDDGVFVLDAFFEIFVILIIRSLAPAPHQKSAESSAFRAALLFAQEYGILAASAEDRPFVPVSSVVICSRNASGVRDVEAVPEGMMRAFRKWDGNAVKECRVVELTAALEAVGETR